MPKVNAKTLLRFVPVMFFNPANIVRDEDERDATEIHRENTPWYIIFPTLGVTMMARDPESDEPIVGYWTSEVAVHLATAIYMALTADPKKLEYAVKNNECPDFIQTYHKVMSRGMVVPAL